MKRIILDKQRGTSARESRTLYIYFDYKFKQVQRITPNQDKFNGNWKDLADAVTGSSLANGKQYYKFEVK